jgi:hypothetical protein
MTLLLLLLLLQHVSQMGMLLAALRDALVYGWQYLMRLHQMSRARSHTSWALCHTLWALHCMT